MKLFAILVLAASILVPLILASDSKLVDVDSRESLPGPEQQTKCPDGSLITLLPREIWLNILQGASHQKLVLVCHGLRRMIREHFVPELRTLFDDKYCFERYFQSEQERDSVFSIIIAADCAEVVKQAEEAESLGTLVSPHISTHIRDELMENMFIKLLSTLPASDPKTRLLRILGDGGSFLELPLVARQLIARHVWPYPPPANPQICPLHSFLSLFHRAFNGFKDSLAELDPWTFTEACVNIVFGIDCLALSREDKERLLALSRSMHPDHLPLDMVCSLHASLSSNPSISEICRVVQYSYPPLYSTVCRVLEASPAYVTAGWCMAMLGKQTFPFLYDSLQLSMLFSDGFREKHGISNDDQSLLLELCNAADLLKNVSHAYLDSSERQALVKWVNGKCDVSTLSFADVVTLYSLDNDPGALSKYLKSPKDMDWLALANIALQIDYARHLSDTKRDALLKHLYPEYASTFDANSDSDRKTLIANVMSSFTGPVSDAFVCSLSESDFRLCVKAWLDDPEGCRMPDQLDDQRKQMAARKLVDYVGNDTSKMASLKRLPVYCQAVVFLWTDCDAVADFLSKSLNNAVVIIYFMEYWRRPGFNKHEEVSRAALRTRAVRQSLLTVLSIQ